MTYTPEQIAAHMEHLDDKMEKIAEEEVDEHCDEYHKHDKENSMDIAGLMALMQQGKGMDLGTFAALCKDKGGDTFGGGGGMWVLIILLFLMMNGGFGNNANRDAAAAVAAREGFDLQTITSLYDRNAATLQAVNAGFANLNTSLCSSIAEVIASVRNQGDRNYDATRNVGDQVRDCCCRLEAAIVSLGCKIDQIIPAVNLAQERNLNAMQAMECRLSSEIKENRNQSALGFERLNCKLDMQCKDAEIARLREKNEAYRENEVAQRAVHQQANWFLANYTPTRTPIIPPVA